MIDGGVFVVSQLLIMVRNSTFAFNMVENNQNIATFYERSSHLAVCVIRGVIIVEKTIQFN